MQKLVVVDISSCSMVLFRPGIICNPIRIRSWYNRVGSHQDHKKRGRMRTPRYDRSVSRPTHAQQDLSTLLSPLGPVFSSSKVWKWVSLRVAINLPFTAPFSLASFERETLLFPPVPISSSSLRNPKILRGLTAHPGHPTGSSSSCAALEC